MKRAGLSRAASAPDERDAERNDERRATAEGDPAQGRLIAYMMKMAVPGVA
jgi:hypothetical protein